MFIGSRVWFLKLSSGGAKCMSLLRSFGILGALDSINIALLTELKTVSDDNPPKLMYKGKAEQISIF